MADEQSKKTRTNIVFVKGNSGALLTGVDYDTSSFSQFEAAGNANIATRNGQFECTTSGALNTDEDNRTICDPRVMVIRYTPSLGGYRNQQYMKNGLMTWFNKITGSAGQTTNFSYADLGKHFFFCDAIRSIMDKVDLALDMYAARDEFNWGLNSQTVFAVTGISYKSIARNFKDAVERRNNAISVLNEILMPSGVTALDRHQYLNSKIFADDSHGKTQLIAFLPRHYYLKWYYDAGYHLDEDEWFTQYRNEDNSSSDIIQILDRLVSIADRYKMDGFYQLLAPYLQNFSDKYGEQMFKFEVKHFETKATLTVTQDETIKCLIRNADYVGDFYHEGVSEDPATTSSASIALWEDEHGELFQGIISYYVNEHIVHYPGLLVKPLIYGANEIDTFAQAITRNRTDYLYYATDRVLNVEGYVAKPELIKVGMSGKIVLKPITLSGNGKAVAQVWSSFIDIFNYIEIFGYKSDLVRTAHNVENKMYCWTCVPVFDKNTNTQRKSNPLLMKDGVATLANIANSDLKVYGVMLRAFNACPNFLTISNNYSNNDENKIHINEYIDVDNLVKIGSTNIDTFDSNVVKTWFSFYSKSN